MEAIEEELVGGAGLQAGHEDLVLVAPHEQGLGLPICVLILDHKGVEGAPDHAPGEAQGVRGHVPHRQHP